MRARTVVIAVLVPATIVLFWLASREDRAQSAESARPAAADQLGAAIDGGAPSAASVVEARPSLDSPPLQDAGDRVAAGLRVGFRPVADVRESIRASAIELVAKLEAIRVEARLSDEQWEAVLQDLLEAAIERRRGKDYLSKDMLGQPVTESDWRAADEAGEEDLRGRLAQYLTPKQLRTFEFRLSLQAVIGWAENTDILIDKDRPAAKLWPNRGEEGLADL